MQLEQTDVFVRGVKLLYLPPYSPDFNPIEEAFAFLKAFIRKHGLRFCTAAASGDIARPIMFLYEALDQVTTRAAHGWIRHAGYM
jgi:hypothetical protein